MPPGGTSEISQQQAVQHWWKERWGRKSYQWGVVGVSAPCRNVLKTHKDLRKAESAVLTQIRTGRIGLAAFLNKVRVPDFPSPQCRCGQAQETAAHIILHCPLYAEARERLCVPGERLDIRALVSFSKGARCLT